MRSLSFFNELKLIVDSDHAVAENLTNQQSTFDGERIRGVVRRTGIEPGLTLYDWQVYIAEAHKLTYRAEPNLNEPAFKLVYYFQPPPKRTFFEIEGEGILQARDDSFLLIYPVDKVLSVTFAMPGPLNCIALTVAYSWLDQQLQSYKETNAALQEIVQWVRSSRLRTLSKGEAVLAQSLFAELSNAALRIEVKAHVYNLITSFYRQVKFAVLPEARNEYATVLESVEQRIMKYLDTSLPPLETFAAEFYMSFSSLNRHFKKQYGVTIYAYYLQKKMELASELLLNNGASVKAVASQLGYESATHFISIFKKTHGYSPGTIRDRQG